MASKSGGTIPERGPMNDANQARPPIERPIIFSAPMVEAILSGRKTMTRRIIKPQLPGHWSIPPARLYEGFLNRYGCSRGDESIKCPFQVGMTLWVRENFFCSHVDFDQGGKLPKERPEWADEMLHYCCGRTCCDQIPECCCAEVGKPKNRPSIHMPRWASRINLEIADVRAEQLQDITEADAIAEGIRNVPGVDSGMWFTSNRNDRRYTAKAAFSDLWDRIHGDGAWGLNPWLWVVAFKRVEVSQ